MCLGLKSAFAIQFCTDFLESGNDGGSAGLKTFDREWVVGRGETAKVDIWINGITEPLLTAGFWLLFDPSILIVESVAAFDDNDLNGPWDHLMTRKAPNPRGPGYLFACGNLSGTPPDGCGDTLIARVTFRCNSAGSTLIAFATIPNFDSVVGNSGTLYDGNINRQSSVIPMPELLRGFHILWHLIYPDSPKLPLCIIEVM